MDNPAAQKNISLHCESESEERAIVHEKQQHLGDSKREAVVDLQTQTVVLTHPVEHRILEKNMHLNVLQQFFQNIKIQFFYSKRKQPKKKTASEPAIRLNPWIVIIGIILFIGVNCVMYAMDRYKQYKIESRNAMFYLGQIIEYHDDKGYGLLLDHHSAQTVAFYIADFPKEGGQPKKGETIKYVVINDKGAFKAHQMIRLDVAMSNDLKSKKVDIDKQRNILRASQTDSRKFGFISFVILVMVFGLVYFSFAAWTQYQSYQKDQLAKFELFEQQQETIDTQTAKKKEKNS
ncbi:hypothetical protein FQR65_LT19245 [Abscondita terminalis]|nr:hypothetical protein FQR65_LT19245 [Abscondita terminalis]